MKLAKKAKSEVPLDLEKMAETSPGLRKILAEHVDLDVKPYIRAEDNYEKSEEIVRVQLDLPQSKIDMLTALMSDLGIGTRKDLFNNALSLLAWAAKEKKKGNIIISLNEDTDVQKELVMHPLENVAALGRKREINSKGNNVPPPPPSEMGGYDDDDESDDGRP